MNLQNRMKWIACMMLAFALASCSSPTKNKEGEGGNTEIDMAAQTEGDMPADESGGKPEVRLDDVGGILYGQWESIHFDYDSATIRSDDRKILEEVAKWMQDNPGKKVMVAGNCDERGTVEYNLALGQRRASAAREYLIKLGAPSKDIGTISYGEERPVDPAHNDSAWAQNRRDDFGIQKKS